MFTIMCVANVGISPGVTVEGNSHHCMRGIGAIWALRRWRNPGSCSNLPPWGVQTPQLYAG